MATSIFMRAKNIFVQKVSSPQRVAAKAEKTLQLKVEQVELTVSNAKKSIAETISSRRDTELEVLHEEELHLQTTTRIEMLSAALTAARKNSRVKEAEKHEREDALKQLIEQQVGLEHSIASKRRSLAHQESLVKQLRKTLVELESQATDLRNSYEELVTRRDALLAMKSTREASDAVQALLAGAGTDGLEQKLREQEAFEAGLRELKESTPEHQFAQLSVDEDVVKWHKEALG